MALSHVADLLASLQLCEAHALQKRLAADADKRAVLLASQRGEQYPHILTTHANITECILSINALLEIAKRSEISEQSIPSTEKSSLKKGAQSYITESSETASRFVVPLAVNFLIKCPELIWSALETSDFVKATELYVVGKLLYRHASSIDPEILRQYTFVPQLYDALCRIEDRIAYSMNSAIQTMHISEPLINDLFRGWLLLKPQQNVKDITQYFTDGMLNFILNLTKQSNMRIMLDLAKYVNIAVQALIATTFNNCDNAEIIVQELRGNCLIRTSNLLGYRHQSQLSDTQKPRSVSIMALRTICLELVPTRTTQSIQTAVRAVIINFNSKAVQILKQSFIKCMSKASGREWLEQMKSLAEIMTDRQHIDYLQSLSEPITVGPEISFFMYDVALETACTVLKQLITVLENQICLVACPPVNQSISTNPSSTKIDLWSSQSIDDVECSFRMLNAKYLQISTSDSLKRGIDVFLRETDFLLISDSDASSINSLIRGNSSTMLGKAIRFIYDREMTSMLQKLQKKLAENSQHAAQTLTQRETQRNYIAQCALNVRSIGLSSSVNRLGSRFNGANDTSTDVHQIFYDSYMTIIAYVAKDLCNQISTVIHTQSDRLFLEERINLQDTDAQSMEHSIMLPFQLSPFLLFTIFAACEETSFLFSYLLETESVIMIQTRLADTVFRVLAECWHKLLMTVRSEVATALKQTISTFIDPIEFATITNAFRDNVQQQAYRLCGLLGVFAHPSVSFASSQSSKTHSPSQLSKQKLKFILLPTPHDTTVHKTKLTEAKRRRSSQLAVALQTSEEASQLPSSRENIKTLMEQGQKATQELQERAKEFFRSKGGNLGMQFGNFFSGQEEK